MRSFLLPLIVKNTPLHSEGERPGVRGKKIIILFATKCIPHSASLLRFPYSLPLCWERVREKALRSHLVMKHAPHHVKAA
jgi:hypothetical protein